MNNNNSKGARKIAMFSIHSDPLASLGTQETGGQNVYVRYLAEELEKFGWDVDIFTRWDSPHKKQIAHITKHSKVIRLKGGPVCYIPKKELFPILPEIFNNFLIFNNFQNPYHLFHGHYWDGGWMALEAHRKFQKPLVENFHSLGVIRMETQKKYLKTEEEHDYFVKRVNLENEIIRESSVIISLSETEKQNLNRFYGCPLEKVVVIPGGVNLKHWPLLEKQKVREYLKIKPEEFVVLFVGRLEWRKGIGTLISACRLLRPEIPNLKLLIVGGKIFGRNKNSLDFREYKRLQKKSRKEKVNNLTVFTGNIDHRKLPFFYRAADVFVVPSYYEPFGLVALEGMASRVPVLASNVGGLSTIIRDGKTGLLFEPRNALALKEKILLLYKSKNLVNTLTENAYKEVTQKYSWVKITKMVSNIYEQYISQNEKLEKNIAKEFEHATDKA